MTPLLTQPVVQTYALCASILVVLLYALGAWTAKVRNDRHDCINPEDINRVNFGAHAVEIEHPDVQRVKRAHLNLLENAVPFFVIGFLYSQTMPSLGVARSLMFGFVVVRILHAIFYLNAFQPFRTISFALGAFINAGMAIQVLRAVL